MSKGEETRRGILKVALEDASELGLEGLSIGSLATRVGMSKSGLFAHFGSKQGLQVGVLNLAAEFFANMVVRPVIDLPRGEPRVRAIYDNWLAWTGSSAVPGGCVFISTAFELDHRPGPVRDVLVAHLQELRGAVERSARIAVEEGHFHAGLDTAEFAFDLHAIVLGYHVETVFEPGAARKRSDLSFERLLDRARTER